MKSQNFYYDDPDIGPSKETSHPNFVKCLSSEFYYDCTDEFSPFGNDDGADLLYNLEDWYKETKGEDSIIDWLFQTIDEGGFKYSSKDCAEILDKEKIKKIQDEDPNFILFMDSSIIAGAFGQFKVSGKIEPGLKKYSLQAIKRQKMLTDNEEYLNHLSEMEKDLEKIE